MRDLPISDWVPPEGWVWPDRWAWRLVEHWWNDDLDVCQIHSIWFDKENNLAGWSEGPETAMGLDASEVLNELDAIARDIRMNPMPVLAIERQKNRWRWLVGDDREWQELLDHDELPDGS
jgi:hypothetical protein